MTIYVLIAYFILPYSSSTGTEYARAFPSNTTEAQVCAMARNRNGDVWASVIVYEGGDIRGTLIRQHVECPARATLGPLR